MDAVDISIKQNLIISVREARKLLGKKSQNLSDYQIEDLILLLTSLAEDFLQNNGS